MVEKRINRSKFKDVAMQLWLESVGKRAGAPTIIVVDTIGLLVASGVSSIAAEEMAGKVIDRVQPGDQEITVVDESEKALVIRSTDWKGEKLYVCATGQPDSARDGIDEAISGIHRILSNP